MIPRTRNGLDPMVCISGMQKSIRRGLEREAMELAVELIGSSKPFFTMVCRRLQIVSHEDVDAIAQPHIVPFVKASVEQAQQWYDPAEIGASRMAIGNAIRMMARARKSRATCHFAAAVGLRSMLEDFVPVIPDFALDQHTLAGRKLRRGLDHFLREGAMLIPPPTEPDPFEQEAVRLWTLKAALEKQQKRADLFDAD